MIIVYGLLIYGEIIKSLFHTYKVKILLPANNQDVK